MTARLFTDYVYIMASRTRVLYTGEAQGLEAMAQDRADREAKPHMGRPGYGLILNDTLIAEESPGELAARV